MAASRFQILALGDEPEVLGGLSSTLRARGVWIEGHRRVDDALAALRTRGHAFDAVVLDLDSARGGGEDDGGGDGGGDRDADGLAVLDALRTVAPAAPIVCLVGERDDLSIREALERGALQVLSAPLADPDAGALAVSSACRVGRLARRAAELERRATELERQVAPTTDATDATGATGRDPLAWTDELSFREARKRAQTRFEVAYLRRLLDQTDGNVSEAARRAGLDRSNFRRVLNRVGIKP